MKPLPHKITRYWVWDNRVSGFLMSLTHGVLYFSIIIKRQLVLTDLNIDRSNKDFFK